MKKFKDHWYAPRHFANLNASTGERFHGAAAHYMVDSRSNRTSGFAATKPWPLDDRGCYVRLEDDGRVTITLHIRDEYLTGSREEIVAHMRAVADAVTPADEFATQGVPRTPLTCYPTDEDWQALRAEQAAAAAAYAAKLRERAAILAAAVVEDSAHA